MKFLVSQHLSHFDINLFVKIWFTSFLDGNDPIYFVGRSVGDMLKNPVQILLDIKFKIITLSPTLSLSKMGGESKFK